MSVFEIMEFFLLPVFAIIPEIQTSRRSHDKKRNL